MDTPDSNLRPHQHQGPPNWIASVQRYDRRAAGSSDCQRDGQRNIDKPFTACVVTVWHRAEVVPGHAPPPVEQPIAEQLPLFAPSDLLRPVAESKQEPTKPPHASRHAWARLPSWHAWQVTLGFIGFAWFALGLRRALVSAASAERRQVRWLLGSALLSLVPMVASFPSSRLLLPASVAFAAAFACMLNGLWRQLRMRPALVQRPPVAVVACGPTRAGCRHGCGSAWSLTLEVILRCGFQRSPQMACT